MTTAGAIRAPTASREMMEMPGVVTCYTAQMFSKKAKCYLRIRRKHEVHTTIPLYPHSTLSSVVLYAPCLTRYPQHNPRVTPLLAGGSGIPPLIIERSSVGRKNHRMLPWANNPRLVLLPMGYLNEKALLHIHLITRARLYALWIDMEKRDLPGHARLRFGELL